MLAMSGTAVLTAAASSLVPSRFSVLRLRDGTPIRIRPVHPSDRAAVEAFLHRISLDSFELRYFSPIREEIALEQILAQGHHGDEVSLVMELDGASPTEIVAQAEYVRDPLDRTRAEVAFLVADRYQGQGAATLLLWSLARRARSQGITTFTALVLPENYPMCAVFTGAGFPCGLEHFQDETEVTLDIRDEPSLGLVPCTARPSPSHL
jgi:RimJ/RimL family protein N-acetyltransferase